MPEITVIIPTFNREEYVPKAIDSVLNQSFQNYEIVVVDDGSTDNTRAALQHYGKAIRYICQVNQGVSAARNAGIRVATGEWVAFLDSDDEWVRDYLETQMEYAGSNSTICMQSTDACVIQPNGRNHRYFQINQSIGKFKGCDYLLVERPFSFIVRHGPWQIGSTIVRRAAIKKAGLFDVTLRLSEDFDLMARVGLLGSFGLIRKELVKVYRRAEPIDALTIQAKHQPIEARQSDERMYKKLMNVDGVTAAERRSLRASISANRRAIGNLLLDQGDRDSAERSYAYAVASYPSVRSLGKYALYRASHLFRRSGRTGDTGRLW